MAKALISAGVLHLCPLRLLLLLLLLLARGRARTTAATVVAAVLIVFVHDVHAEQQRVIENFASRKQTAVFLHLTDELSLLRHSHTEEASWQVVVQQRRQVARQRLGAARWCASGRTGGGSTS
jgi:hypothetical protein